MRIQGKVCLIAAILSVSIAQAQKNPTQAAASLRSSVVRVIAESCHGTPSHSGTGFVWENAHTVATALHVVASCDIIRVYFEVQGQTPKAELRYYSSDADLALLTVDDPPKQAPPLSARSGKPNLGEDFAALGFGLASGQKKMDTTSAKLRAGGNKLIEIVGKDVADALSERRSPSVGLTIFPLESHLVPGLSGAPIIDSSGNVVAIADGGLEQGAINSSWGIPISELANRSKWAQFNRQNPPQFPLSSHLFAFDVLDEALSEVSCGGVTLTKTKTRSFDQLVATADNGALLRQQASELTMLHPEKMEFEVYEHQPSGATVVLPAGARLREAPGMCRAELLEGQVTLNVALAIEHVIQGAEAKSQMFEGLLLDLTPAAWQSDPDANAEITRFDGLVVHRRGYLKRREPTSTQASSLKGVFETLALRNNVFLGVGLVYNLGIQDLMAQAMSCNQRKDCDASLDRIRAWAQAFACVELSTFSIG